MVSKAICALTVYTATQAYYLQAFQDEQGYFVSVNGIHIRPPVEDTIDTRKKAIQWTLELYRLYPSGD